MKTAEVYRQVGCGQESCLRSRYWRSDQEMNRDTKEPAPQEKMAWKPYFLSNPHSRNRLL